MFVLCHFHIQTVKAESKKNVTMMKQRLRYVCSCCMSLPQLTMMVMMI